MILMEILKMISAAPVAHAAEIFSCAGNLAQTQGLSPLFNPENKGIMSAAIATAGIKDAVSYHSLPILILMLGHIIAFTKTRRGAIKMGLIYAVTILLTFLASVYLFGANIFQLFELPYYPQLVFFAKYFFVLLLAGAALFNVLEFIFGQKFIPQSILRFEKKHEPLLVKMIYGWTVLVGIVAVLFIIPCTYLSFFQTVAFSYMSMTGILLWYIILYSFMFIVPLLIVLAIAVRVEWYIRHRQISSDNQQHRWLKLIKVLIQVSLAGILAFI